MVDYCIRRSGLGGSSATVCPSGAALVAGRKYGIYDAHGNELSDDAAAAQAPADLVALLHEMREAIEDPSADSIDVGVAELALCQQGYCPVGVGLGVYEEVAPALGKYGPAMGLAIGHYQRNINSRGCDRIAPSLGNFMHRKYGTTPKTHGMESPAETAEREKKEEQQRRQLQREEQARSAAREEEQRQESHKQRQDAAIAAIAGALKVSRERAEQVLAAVGDYFGLTA
jgi:hypothetical protein